MLAHLPNRNQPVLLPDNGSADPAAVSAASNRRVHHEVHSAPSDLALQLPFFEMSALRDGLVDSAPE
jgi:hypothetical protein